MKRLAFLLALLFAMPAVAQIGYGTAKRIQYGATLPATCSPLTGDVYFLTTGNVGAYQCLVENAWTAIGSGSSGGNFGNLTNASSYANIQAALTAAGPLGALLIPSNYAPGDTYTNSNKIQILDLRGGPSRYRGLINMLTDCGLKGDGVTDDTAAANACFTAYPSHGFIFPQTKASGACSYFFSAPIFPHGEGALVTGEAGGFKNSNTSQGGTLLCFAVGASGVWLDMTPNSTSGITLENFSLQGSEGTDGLTSPTKLNIPANLPQFTRSIATIQRTANVLTVTTSLIRNEGLTQLVGSTVKISGVVGDTTMNGNCVIATLTGLNTFGENPTGFTCPQNGADTIAFGAVGTVGLPTTGASQADGIRICSNFNTVRNVAINGFGRHGVNADMQAGHGCTTLFSDDLYLENVTMKNNQGNGFYCQGIDCNAGTMVANPIYYNLLWGVEDQSSLGNNWFGTQISNNGSQWAVTTTPATKAINSISRALSGGISQVSVVLSVADANIKQGSCVVIAAVTDVTFNTATVNPGGCFFINSYTDSTHFGYEQPGAPANASSSGGTSRMAKFSEAYLSAGVDSGAAKISTQSQTYSHPWVGTYIEGGQNCKFAGTVMTIQGANMPTCSASSTWQPGGAIFQNSFNNSLASTVSTFTNNKDQNMSVSFIAGKNGGTTRHILERYYSNTTATDSWGIDIDPSGVSGTTGSWRLSRGTAGSGVARLQFFGATNASGITRLSSESVGAIQFNISNGDGTGGIAMGDGAGNTTMTVSGAGLATFNGGVKVSAGAQALTSVQGSTGTKVAAATGAFVSGNCVKTDVSGNFVDHGAVCGSTSYVFSSGNKRWELFDSTIPTWLIDAKPALTIDIPFALMDQTNFIGGGIKHNLSGVGTPSTANHADSFGLVTSSVSSDNTNLAPVANYIQLQNLQSFWTTFKLPSTASLDLRIGYMNNTPFGGSVTDGVYLEALNADTNWFLVTMNTSVQTRCDTTIAKGTAAQSFVVTVTTSSVSAFIPGTASAKCTNSTNIPAAATLLSSDYGIRTQTAAAKTIDMMHFGAVGKQTGY